MVIEAARDAREAHPQWQHLREVFEWRTWFRPSRRETAPLERALLEVPVPLGSLHDYAVRVGVQ